MASAFDFLEGSVTEAARRLLGCELRRQTPEGSVVAGIIVETESYDQLDAASHSYRGRTPRTDTMFGAAGQAYVYFTYGMHYCLNVVTGHPGVGSAVLIRALQPTVGIAAMQSKRGVTIELSLTNGPAKLCQALGIDKTLNGHDLHYQPLQLIIHPALAAEDMVTTTRIGITRDVDRPWRFYQRDNPFVSKR